MWMCLVVGMWKNMKIYGGVGYVFAEINYVVLVLIYSSYRKSEISLKCRCFLWEHENSKLFSIAIYKGIPNPTFSNKKKIHKTMTIENKPTTNLFNSLMWHKTFCNPSSFNFYVYLHLISLCSWQLSNPNLHLSQILFIELISPSFLRYFFFRGFNSN